MKSLQTLVTHMHEHQCTLKSAGYWWWLAPLHGRRLHTSHFNRFKLTQTPSIVSRPVCTACPWGMHNTACWANQRNASVHVNNQSQHYPLICVLGLVADSLDIVLEEWFPNFFVSKRYLFEVFLRFYVNLHICMIMVLWNQLMDTWCAGKQMKYSSF